MAGETPHTVKRSKAATNVLILVSGIAVTAVSLALRSDLIIDL